MDNIQRPVICSCRCRWCEKHYDEAKSRSDYKGYCSQKCLHDKAKALGYKKANEKKLGYRYSEYWIMSNNKAFGSVVVNANQAPKKLSKDALKTILDLWEDEYSLTYEEVMPQGGQGSPIKSLERLRKAIEKAGEDNDPF